MPHTIDAESPSTTRGGSSNHGRWRTFAALMSEGAGALGLVSLGVLALAHLSSVPRAYLLYDAGDSVLFALMRRSREVGEASDWIYSPVLFWPEHALYGLLSALETSPQATLAVNAVVNVVLFGLFGRFALAPVLRNTGRAFRIYSSIIPAALLTLFVLFESSADRHSFELVSLLLLTTYYAGTIWGTLVVVGCLLRLLAGGTRAWYAVMFLVVVLSTITNPMFAVWCLAPTVGVLAVWCLQRRAVDRRSVGVVGVMVLGGLIGVLARTGWTDPGDYALDPFVVAPALSAYWSPLAARLATPTGATELVIGLALIGVTAVAVMRLPRASVARVPLLLGSLGPLIVAVVLIALGTWPARYAEPLFFLPMSMSPAVLLAAPSMRKPSPAAIRGIATTCVLVLALGATATLPGVVRRATVPDADTACVLRWAAAHDRVGAGDYWSYRGIQYRLRDPRQLVQIGEDGKFRDWLSNRHDVDGVRSVSWIVRGMEAMDVSLHLDDPSVKPVTVRCGDYTVFDYRRPVIDLR
jgi:hypothetical protein